MIILYWEREINHERHPAVAGLTGELARHEKEQIHFILQAREHEVNEVKPGNAALRSGFMHFAFGDQSRDCGTGGNRCK